MICSPKVLDILASVTETLYHSTDTQSPFYEFILAHPEHRKFVVKFSDQLKEALGFVFVKDYGKSIYNKSYVDKNNKQQLLFTSYLDAVAGLHNGDKSNMTALLSHDISSPLVNVIYLNNRNLQELNNDFLKHLGKPNRPLINIAAHELFPSSSESSCSLSSDELQSDESSSDLSLDDSAETLVRFSMHAFQNTIAVRGQQSPTAPKEHLHAIGRRLKNRFTHKIKP